MKTIRITLVKDGAQAVCTNKYHFKNDPESSDWTGNHQAFTLRDGRPLDLSFSIDALDKVCAFQCAQCAATYTIEDLGGEAVFWTDHVEL
jgi:hypothetical protein